MNEFNDSLSVVLTFQPFVTFVFASLGLATVVHALWLVLKRFLGYFSTNDNHMIVFWGVLLIVFGGTTLGYGVDTQKDTFKGSGIASLACGVIINLIYWIRKWVKWCHKEIE